MITDLYPAVSTPIRADAATEPKRWHHAKHRNQRGVERTKQRGQDAVESIVQSRWGTFQGAGRSASVRNSMNSVGHVYDSLPSDMVCCSAMATVVNEAIVEYIDSI